MEERSEISTGYDLDSNGLRRPGLTQISILFSIVIVLFLMIGYRVQKREFYSGILITEFALIMLPALIFLLAYKYDLKKVLRLNKVRFLNLFVIFWIMAFAIPIAGVFNLINLWLVNSIFGKVIVSQPPVAENLAGLVVNILVIGGSAGLCEEFLFRGVIQRGLERFGAVKAILLAAFLFGLTHVDFQKLFGTFLLGALIGFIVYRSNSLYAGMFAHFTNNSLVVLIGYAANKFLNALNGPGVGVPASQMDLSELFSMFEGMSKEQMLIVAFVYGIIFLFFITIFISLVFALIKLTPGKSGKTPPVRMRTGIKGLLWLIPGVSFIAVMYIVEGLKFTGTNSGIVDQIRRLLGVG